MLRLLFSAAVSLFLALALAVSAQETAPPDGERGAVLRVTGEGSVAAIPDMAVLNLGVEATAISPGAAVDAMATAMGPVIDGVIAAGVAPRDVQTSQLSLRPIYRDGQLRTQEGPQIDGYVARTNITLRVRDLDGLGDLLDASVLDGANRFEGLQFAVADPQPLRDAALTAAIVDATRKASLMAEAAGLRLGPILEIAESGGAQPPGPVMMEAARSSAIPIAPGELEMRANVSVVFGLVSGS